MIQEQTIQTTYGRMRVYQAGSGPKSLVLLHGSGSDSAMLSFREVQAAREMLPCGVLHVFEGGKH